MAASTRTIPIRLGIAGIGLVGKRHAEAIRRQRNVALASIVDPSDAGQRYANEYGLPWFASLSELFEVEKPDGVILATPTPLHVQQGLECIAEGCPILVEKPLSTSVADGEVLVDAAEREGIPLLVGHHRRHNPLIQKAKELIDGGEIGQTRTVHAHCGSINLTTISTRRLGGSWRAPGRFWSIWCMTSTSSVTFAAKSRMSRPRRRHRRAATRTSKSQRRYCASRMARSARSRSRTP